MNIFDLLSLIGGLCLFLFGMSVMGDALERRAGERLKKILAKLTKNKLAGFLTGLGITAIIQSSSATTVMVVGFVNSGIMTLKQSISVIMGANIGTTATAWILSLGGISSDNVFVQLLKPTSFTPVLALIGTCLMMFGKTGKKKDSGTILLGFATLMFGMDAMSGAVSGLAELPQFQRLFIAFKNPLLGVIVGAVLTAVIQSSSASVGILQALSSTGQVSYGAAIPIIMGQNIGTCVTAILSSLGAKKNAKTAALMHLLFNIIGTIIFSMAAIAFFTIVRPVWASGSITQTEISLAHTVFNVATTVILFPVSGWIMNLAKKIGNVKEDEQDRSKVLLDERMLETPSIALQSTVNETLRMGEVVRGSLETARRVLYTKDSKDIEALKEDEDVVDKLCAGITAYAIRLGTLQISEKEHQTVAHLLQILSDIERVSDYCENISEFAETLVEKKVSFSTVAREHLDEMMDASIDSFTYALEAVREDSVDKAMVVVEKETRVDELEIQLRSMHIRRLAKNECSTEAGIVFLDTLVCLERISDHARNIVEEVLV